MNRDATVIQAAILLIIIAILGVAIIKKQQAQRTIGDPIVVVEEIIPTQPVVPQPPTQGETANVTTDVVTNKPLIEQLDSDNANLVRQYFKALGAEDFTQACSTLSPAKCSSVRPAAVNSFSQEYKKLANGYEYLNIKDYGIISPSGKNVVCVKYSYRYLDDANQSPISEVLSFYVDYVDGELKITDRVCEKKYKDGMGVRPCPVQAIAEFCEGKVR